MELNCRMLPLEITLEVKKDKFTLDRRTTIFRRTILHYCRDAKEYPVWKVLGFKSNITGIEWKIILACFTFKLWRRPCYFYYTLYKNEYGATGFFLYNGKDVGQITPHYIERYKQRYLDPKGIKFDTIEELIEYYIVHNNAGMSIGGHRKQDEDRCRRKDDFDYFYSEHGISFLENAGGNYNLYKTFVTHDMVRENQHIPIELSKLGYKMMMEQNLSNAEFEEALNSAGITEDKAVMSSRSGTDDEDDDHTQGFKPYVLINSFHGNMQMEKGDKETKLPSRQSWLDNVDVEKALKKIKSGK